MNKAMAHLHLVTARRLEESKAPVVSVLHHLNWAYIYAWADGNYNICESVDKTMKMVASRLSSGSR